MRSAISSQERARVRRALARRGRRAEFRVRRRFPTLPRSVACPVCGWAGPQFAPSYNPRRPNRICPNCHSSERYRALEITLRDRGRVLKGTRLLEVAPIKTVERTARELGYDYTSLDLRSSAAQVRGDLCRLPFPDGTFDLVVCFHVLEHIPDDRAAAAELARVVGVHGEAFVVVPREDGRPETFEDPGADPADFEHLYGQSDHVRIYGADITDRWRKTGIEVVEHRWIDCFAHDVERRAVLAGDDDRYWVLRPDATNAAS